MPELRQRQPRIKNPAFLTFVRGRHCCVCGAPPKSHAAHIRMASADHGKRECGKGEKPSDRFATPLCARCHLLDQHGGSERDYWQRVRKNPFAIAARLYALFEAERGPQPQHVVRVTGMRPKRLNGIYIFHINKSNPKRKWASRPLKGAGRWPAKGSRKVGR